MKKILFTLCFLLSGIIVTAQEVSYKIKGQFPTSINSEVLLVANGEKGPVTIGNSIIKNGVFTFEGNIPSGAIIYLMPKERNAVWATLFLYENSEYTISTDVAGIINVDGGGEYQKIYGEFESINKYLSMTKHQCEMKAKSLADPSQLQGLQDIMNEAVSKAQIKEAELFKKHSDSFVTAYFIASTMLVTKENILKERYQQLGSTAKNSPYGIQILDHLSKLEKVAIDATAPDFSAALSDGGTMKLHETDAKVKIVYFWVTGAAPCREENVNMLKLYKQYRPVGLEIIGVSLDQNKQTWLTALGEDGATWKNILDPNGEIISQYCVTSIPALFILNEKNQIVAKNIYGENLKSKVEEMLGKK